MRVLITGSTGFVGSYVKNYLASLTRWEIVASDTDLTEQLPEMGTFDYIINLASRSSVEESVNKPADFIDTNVKIAINVLEYARTHTPKVFLQFSTVEVYNVTNPYAASKIAQEEIANAYWKTYNLPILIARSSNIIGPGQSPDKFIPKAIKTISHDEILKIYSSDGIIGSRVYNPIMNIADAIHFMLKIYSSLKNYDKNFPVHFDIGGGQKLTNLEMAQKIASRLHKELRFEIVEPKVERPTYASTLHTIGQKLEEYGWKPMMSLEEGLQWIR